MFEILGLNKKQIYPVLVVSTMSSGKSTLINAIIGRELMPSMIRACTARAMFILDNDAKSRFGIHIVKRDGTYCFSENEIEKNVLEYNETNHIGEMIIEGNIPGVRNGRKALLLIDTPGLGYSLEPSHERITKETLDEYEEGLILYVMNAQQVGTNDESNALNIIANKIKNTPQFKVIFVINKMDVLDISREAPGELMGSCRKIIQSLGIGEPFLIPVSADSALIFKKIISKQSLSFTDIEDFEFRYKRFRRNGFSLLDYVDISEYGNKSEILTVGDEKYTCAEIYAALDNTGVPFLESEIDKILSGFQRVKRPKIIVKKCEKKAGRKS